MSTSDESEKKSTVREYYEALLIAVIFVNFARIFVFQAFKIPTGSMEDNLKIGDHIIVNKFIYGPARANPLRNLIPIRDIRRGDIIVFRYPLQPDTDFVKRVIGLPGETHEVCRCPGGAPHSARPVSVSDADDEDARPRSPIMRLRVAHP